MVSTRKTFILVRRDGAYRQAIVERRRTINEVGGVSDAEIGRNSPTHSAICLYGLVFPGWKPEFDPWQILADANDVAKMLDALQVAGIMPTEVAVFGAIDKVSYGLYPAGMGETPEAFLHRCLDVRKHISATHGVATKANRLRNLLQEAAKSASVGRECVAVSRHLAGIA